MSGGGLADGEPDPFEPEATFDDMLKVVFQMADKDGSGKLSLEEFTNLNERSGDPEAKKIMKMAFENADKGGWFTPKDQKLDLKEFVDFNKKAVDRENPRPDNAT